MEIAPTPETVTTLPAGGGNALAKTLDILGDEWNLWIMRYALQGCRRYADWAAVGDISHSVLSARLTVLTDAGLLERSEYQQNPVRFEYCLTPRGRSVWLVLVSMWAWEKAWAPNPDLPLPPLVHALCGREFLPTLRCGACGGVARAATLDVTTGPSGAFSRSVPAATSRRRSTNPGRRPGVLPHTMELIGNRSSAATLGAAFRGAHRYGEFSEITGAPPAIVADRLRHFTEIGVMESVPLPDNPRWSSYKLTPKGRAFFPIVLCMIAWGQHWFRPLEGDAILMRHRTCGSVFVPRLACDRCGEELHSRDLPTTLDPR